MQVTGNHSYVIQIVSEPSRSIDTIDTLQTIEIVEINKIR